jgi:hypothetical protein
LIFKILQEVASDVYNFFAKINNFFLPKAGEEVAKELLTREGEDTFGVKLYSLDVGIVAVTYTHDCPIRDPSGNFEARG